MNKMNLLNLLLPPALLLSSCTTTGGIATSPGSISAPQTVQALCTGLTAGDAAFQTFAKAHPGVIDANGMSVEGSIMATSAPYCAPGATPNAATAESALITATVQVATLLTTWQK